MFWVMPTVGSTVFWVRPEASVRMTRLAHM